MNPREFIVPLDISADEYRRLYSGAARTVVARDLQGRRLQFPASALRPFVSRTGVQGVFIIRVDGDNRLLGIERARH